MVQPKPRRSSRLNTNFSSDADGEPNFKGFTWSDFGPDHDEVPLREVSRLVKKQKNQESVQRWEERRKVRRASMKKARSRPFPQLATTTTTAAATTTTTSAPDYSDLISQGKLLVFFQMSTDHQHEDEF